MREKSHFQYLELLKVKRGGLRREEITLRNFLKEKPCNTHKKGNFLICLGKTQDKNDYVLFDINEKTFSLWAVICEATRKERIFEFCLGSQTK